MLLAQVTKFTKWLLCCCWIIIIVQDVINGLGLNLCLKTNPVYFGISLVLNMNFVHTGCKWNTFSHTDPSLRSKRFHGVSAQIKARTKKERGFFFGLTLILAQKFQNIEICTETIQKRLLRRLHWPCFGESWPAH